VVSGSGFGGRRPGAGRKPSTLSGILKSLPAEIAELLAKEFKAKAELQLGLGRPLGWQTRTDDISRLQQKINHLVGKRSFQQSHQSQTAALLATLDFAWL